MAVTPFEPAVMSPWVSAMGKGRIFDYGGAIRLELADFEVHDPPKPKTLEESGSKESELTNIRIRNRGPICTKLHIGGAGAVLVDSNHLCWLKDEWMEKLYQKFGEWQSDCYVAFVRTTAGAGVWNCAEPCGGMCESPNLFLELLKEICELGLYNEDGWLRFLLPKELERFQSEFDSEQEFWWRIVAPGLSPIKTVFGQLEFLDFRRSDILNSYKGLVCVGPIGDLTLLKAFRLRVPKDTKFQIIDTECQRGDRNIGEPDWIALKRKPVVICRRPGHAPIMWDFSDEGRLHEGGSHIILSHDAILNNISHLSRALLGQRGLDWLR